MVGPGSEVKEEGSDGVYRRIDQRKTWGVKGINSSKRYLICVTGKVLCLY